MDAAWLSLPGISSILPVHLVLVFPYPLVFPGAPKRLLFYLSIPLGPEMVRYERTRCVNNTKHSSAQVMVRSEKRNEWKGRD